MHKDKLKELQDVICSGQTINQPVVESGENQNQTKTNPLKKTQLTKSDFKVSTVVCTKSTKQITT